MSLKEHFRAEQQVTHTIWFYSWILWYPAAWLLISQCLVNHAVLKSLSLYLPFTVATGLETQPKIADTSVFTFYAPCLVFNFNFV